MDCFLSLCKRKKKNIYVIYSFLFLIIMFLIFSVFFFNDRSFIWVDSSQDGLDQHMTALMYYGEYLREILTNIFIKHKFVLPMWDFSIGYGSDIISTLQYYVIGDPLTLTSVFVPARYTEYLYDFLILLRYYLCGLTFVFYCKYQEKESWASIIGALMYAFCGYAIFAGVRHPYFLNPMIYLPLILVGIEKIYHQESPILFIIMIFISAISNFYFFYMLCLIMFIYAVIRFFSFHHHDYLKNIFDELKKFILYFLLGLGLSAIILIPVIILFFNTSRGSSTASISLTYEISYYYKFILNMFNQNCGSELWTYTGFSVIAFFCILFMFISKKKNYSLIIGYIILTIVLCIPLLGSVFNGLSYVSNRWCFAYALLISYIVVEISPQLINAKKKQLVIMTIAYLGYVVLNYIIVIAMEYQEEYKDSPTFIISLILMGLILILLLLRNNIHLSQKFTIIVLSAFSIISIASNGFLKYSVGFGAGYAANFLESGEAYDILTDNYSTVLKELDDNSFYRYDKYSSSKLRNVSVITQTKSLSFFYSLCNKYISEYLLDMDNFNMLAQRYDGVDHRTQLLILSSTKYLVIENNRTNFSIPYGFDFIETIDDYDIYINSNYLPLGYTYSCYISRSQYEELSTLEKQNVLLNSVLVENDVPLDNYTNDSKISTLFDLSNEDKMIHVQESQQSMEITISLNSNQDVYFSLEDFEYLNDNDDVTFAYITVKMDNVSKTIRINKSNYIYYSGSDDYLAYLGNYNAGEYTITVNYNDTGDYSYDSIQILGQSTDNINENVDKLKENVLTNEYIGTNYASGDIELDEDKFLCLTIPYSSGWTAYVDGEKVTLERANSMYMGIMLEAGSHHIELEYTTPGLKIGAFISGVSLVVLVIYVRRSKLLKKVQGKCIKKFYNK